MAASTRTRPAAAAAPVTAAAATAAFEQRQQRNQRPTPQTCMQCNGNDNACGASQQGFLCKGSGDCDTDEDCVGGTVCGSDNCRDFRSNVGWLNVSNAGKITARCSLRIAAFRPRAASRAASFQSSLTPTSTSSSSAALELSPRSAPLLGAFLVLGGIACVEPREKVVNAWWPLARSDLFITSIDFS